ncbi:MAG: hypothetical protein A2220_07840 [Ignavibacteria bacterium RIFOXYA2_FULL_35_10]|nr:MAG: hypothetical protein A2220_07840 [Ignavibacteria bacterium RIFOXYA2_FULL_35_10]
MSPVRQPTEQVLPLSARAEQLVSEISSNEDDKNITRRIKITDSFIFSPKKYYWNNINYILYLLLHPAYFSRKILYADYSR